MSILPDKVEKYTKVLSDLQDDVEEIPFSDIKKIIENDLNIRIENAFDSFNEKPLASASIGQVHKAKLHSGKEVVIKVQRPGIRKKMREEMQALENLTKVAVKFTEIGKKYALDEILQ